MTGALNWIICVTLTAAAVMAVKRLLRNKMSARLHLLIWLIVLVRMCAVSLPESRVSVFNGLNTQTYAPYVANVDNAARNKGETKIAARQATSDLGTEKPAAADTAEKAGSAADIDRILRDIWILGAVLLGAYFALTYACFSRKLRKSAECTDSDIIRITDECKGMLGIKRKIRLVYGDTPMLKGFFRPTVVIPKGYSASEYRGVILHELCHMRHGDIVLLWLSAAALCVNWFNPIMWYAFAMFRRDVETCCDSRVIAITKDRREYAGLLLKTAAGRKRFALGATSLQNGKKEVEGRIKYIAYFRKPGIIGGALTFVVIAVIAAAFLTNASDKGTDCNMSAARFEEFQSGDVGAVMADIDYADDSRAVFHYLDGIFVYDIKNGGLTKRIDISGLNCFKFQQGSYGIEMRVSADGRRAYIENYGSEDEIKDLDNYELDLKSGRAKKADKQPFKDVFKDLDDSYSNVIDESGWFSDMCVKNDKYTYYLAVSGGKIRDMRFVAVSQNGEKTETWVFDTENERTLAKLPPDKIVGIKSAAVTNTAGEVYTAAADGMKRLETLLNGAKEVKGGSDCPFDAVLDLELEDGTRGRIELASDSCGNYRSGGVYYSCGGDNAELLRIFGMEPAQLSPTDTYLRVSSYLRSEFYRVFSPVYDIKELRISDWKEGTTKDGGAEASFLYTMRHGYYNEEVTEGDPLIDAKKRAEAKDATQKDIDEYNKMREAYFGEKEANFEFKAEFARNPENKDPASGEITLYSNVSPKGVEWQKVKIDDYIN